MWRGPLAAQSLLFLCLCRNEWECAGAQCTSLPGADVSHIWNCTDRPPMHRLEGRRAPHEMDGEVNEMPKQI